MNIDISGIYTIVGAATWIALNLACAIEWKVRKKWKTKWHGVGILNGFVLAFWPVAWYYVGKVIRDWMNDGGVARECPSN